MIARALVVLMLVTGSGAVARAQEQPAPSESDQARSRALYDEGSRAYKSGDYDRAIERFLAAYELSGAPAILFNVAQAHRLAGACDRALTYYRRSLAEEPEAANRAEVEERIAEMQRCVDQRSAESDAGAEPPDAGSPLEPGIGSSGGLTARTAERPSPRRSILPLVTIAVGGAAAVAGGVIYLQARAKFDEVEATCPCEPGSFSGWETATDASYLLMGAGVVAAGAGLIWYWRQSNRRPTRIGLVPTAGGLGWAGSF